MQSQSCVAHRGDHRIGHHRDHGGEITHPEQHDDGHQVNKARQGLQRVDHKAGDGPPTVPLGHPDGDGQADGHSDEARDAAQVDGDHRLFPLPGGGNQKRQARAQKPKAQAPEPPAHKAQKGNDAQPWQTQKEAFGGHQDPCQDRVLHRLKRVKEGDVDPFHQRGPKGAGRKMRRLGVGLHGGQHQADQPGAEGKGQSGHKVRMTGKAPFRRGPRTAMRDGLAQPIQRDGQRHDGQPRLKPGAEIQPAQRVQHLKPQTACTDHRGDDDHIQRQHDDLIDAHQQRLTRRRDQHAPQALARGAANHGGQIVGFGRHARQGQRGDASHRRGGIDQRGNHRRRGAKAEQDQDRHQIGKDRHGLHQIQHRAQGTLKPRVAPCKDAKAKTACHAQRHGHHDRSERHHRGMPMAEDCHEHKAARHQRRQPRPACPMGEERHDPDDGQPRQGRHKLQGLPRLLPLHTVGQKAKRGLIWHINNR